MREDLKYELKPVRDTATGLWILEITGAKLKDIKEHFGTIKSELSPYEIKHNEEFFDKIESDIKAGGQGFVQYILTD